MRLEGVDTQWVLAYSESSLYGPERRGRRAGDLVLLTGYPLHPELDAAASLAFARGEFERLGELRDPALRAGKRHYLAGLIARLEQQASPRPRPKCVALRSHLRLLPNGDVPVCQFSTETLGNLLAESFEALWRGERARDARRWVDGCSGCGRSARSCRTPCTRAISCSTPPARGCAARPPELAMRGRRLAAVMLVRRHGAAT